MKHCIISLVLVAILCGCGTTIENRRSSLSQREQILEMYKNRCENASPSNLFCTNAERYLWPPKSEQIVTKDRCAGSDANDPSCVYAEKWFAPLKTTKSTNQQRSLPSEARKRMDRIIRLSE